MEEGEEVSMEEVELGAEGRGRLEGVWGDPVMMERGC